MIVETTRENLCVNQIIGQKNKILKIEGDIIVPDIKPDILNSINTSGNVCIYKKEILDGKIRIDGTISTYIIYLADDIESNVRGLYTNLDFTEIVDFPNCKPSMNLEVEMNIVNIETNVLNGRKLNIKANVNMEAKVYSNEDISIIKDIKDLSNIQKLNEKLNINNLIGNGSTRVYAKDTINVDELDAIVDILNLDIHISNKENKSSYNKILAKADAQIKIMYLTQDNRVGTIQTNIPIMGFIDVANVTEENTSDIKYELKNVIIKPNQEEHSIYVELEIEILGNVYGNIDIDLIQDLYSPCDTLNFTRKTINTLIKNNDIKQICNIKEKINIPELSSNKIYDVKIKPVINETNVLNKAINYQGEIKLQIMFSSENQVSINSKNVSIPFTFAIDIESDDYNFETIIESIKENFVIISDGIIEASIELEFNVKTTKSVNINLIDEINLEEVKNKEDCSIVMYYVKKSDTLWSIAKMFNSTIEDIAKMNNIEDIDKIDINQQLFIPRYCPINKCKAV